MANISTNTAAKAEFAPDRSASTSVEKLAVIYNYVEEAVNESREIKHATEMGSNVARLTAAGIQELTCHFGTEKFIGALNSISNSENKEFNVTTLLKTLAPERAQAMEFLNNAIFTVKSELDSVSNSERSPLAYEEHIFSYATKRDGNNLRGILFNLNDIQSSYNSIQAHLGFIPSPISDFAVPLSKSFVDKVSHLLERSSGDLDVCMSYLAGEIEDRKERLDNILKSVCSLIDEEKKQIENNKEVAIENAKKMLESDQKVFDSASFQTVLATTLHAKASLAFIEAAESHLEKVAEPYNAELQRYEDLRRKLDALALS